MSLQQHTPEQDSQDLAFRKYSSSGPSYDPPLLVSDSREESQSHSLPDLPKLSPFQDTGWKTENVRCFYMWPWKTLRGYMFKADVCKRSQMGGLLRAVTPFGYAWHLVSAVSPLLPSSTRLPLAYKAPLLPATEHCDTVFLLGPFNLARITRPASTRLLKS